MGMKAKPRHRDDPRKPQESCVSSAFIPMAGGGTSHSLDLGALVSGAAVTETLFRWPGLGSLAVSALLDRDGPVLMGTVLVTCTGVVLSNMLVDLAVAWLDPRTRRERARS